MRSDVLYDVALLGNRVLRSTKENTEDLSLPIMLYMAFDDEGKVGKLTIAAVDLHPLVEAIRAAAQSAIGHAWWATCRCQGLVLISSLIGLHIH